MRFRGCGPLACTVPFLWVGLFGGVSLLTAQTALDWKTVRERFQANSPSIAASRLEIDSVRANEITAGLRPNPEFALVADEFRVFHPNPLAPFQNAQITPVISQLFERRNKRGLRVESARLATSVAQSDASDTERTLLFGLRDAFVKALQAKALLELARENLRYYDQVVTVNRERLRVGDISRSDFARVELQRVQFESDLVNAQVNLRTAKINLLSFLNDKSPVDRFDITGTFDFSEVSTTVEDLRQDALVTRPDLLSATRSIDRARADQRLAWANGSTDPTVGLEYQRTGPDDTAGFSVSIPLRIFDRNQGEKARTEVEVRRLSKARDAAELGVLRDVDSAYAALDSAVALLRPYRDKYLAEAQEVRELVSFAYQNGAASLLDFLDAERSYRDTRLSYLNLVASYLTAANQLNLAVGREVIP